ncbi:MAG: YrdB family protein [Eubacteriaceae bacterium]|nr:YrdB family protein [Eubacteriaceae bacterium]
MFENTIIIANDIIAFVLEMVALYLWGRWAYSMVDNRLLSWFAVIIVVIIFIFIWGLYFSPKAPQKLPLVTYYILKYIVLTLPSVQLKKSNSLIMVLIIVLVAVNLLVQWQLGRGNWNF